MTGRFWFYLPVAIILSGMLSFLLWQQARIASDQQSIQQTSLTDARAGMDRYLSKQKNGRKLVTLAKAVDKTRPELVEPIILRAYELLPNSRDVALLASVYRPEIKERIKDLDPLYQQ